MINLKGKTLLLVNAGNWRKLFVFRIIKKLKINIVCLDREVRPFAKPYVREWLIADMNNEKECIEKVREYLKNSCGIDGVWTFWDECVLLGARIAKEFGWPSVSYEVAKKIKNKYVFRKYCEHQGIPAPRSVIINRKSDIARTKSLKFPIVLKPVFGACSAFVVKVRDIGGVRETFEYINRNIKSFWLSSDWKNLKIVAEEYVGGREVDIDLLIQNGILKYSAIADNEKTNEPYFVETGQSMPSIIKKKIQEEAIVDAFVFLKKLGVDNGCFHFEAKVHKSFGLIPIELNLRMGGGDVYTFSKYVWGVDLIVNAIKIALGINIDINKPSKPYAFLFGRQFLSSKTCVIQDIRIDRRIYNNKDLVTLCFEKKKGDKFLAPPDGYDSSIGWLVVKGNGPRNVRKRWLSLQKMIKIKTV